jgi:xanthine dehydrogenase molybdopterin-binding subunit B
MTYPFAVWGNYAAMVSIYAQDGTVAVAHGGIEMGQGINTKVSLVGTRVNNIIITFFVILSSPCVIINVF